MTYTKNTWANGDVITAAKLNNIEDGIAMAGGLPAATSADEGKHLVVNNEIHPTSTVIVPEQTVSYDAEAGNYPLSNCVPSLFNDEGYVYAVINGTVVSGTPVEEGEGVYFLCPPDESLFIERHGNSMDVFMSGEDLPASITVSVYVGEKRVEWDKEAIPTPAAVIRIQGSPYLVEGSFSAVKTAIHNLDATLYGYKTTCPIILGICGAQLNSQWFTTPILLGYRIDSRDGTEHIVLAVRNYFEGNSNVEYYIWYEDDTIVYQD